MDIPAAKDVTTAFLGNRERLGRLAARKLNPLLSSIVSTDDILQETFMASQRRQLFFASRPNVPVYFKFRKILFQVLAECERRHLGVMKRDPAKEISLNATLPDGKNNPADTIAAKAPSPATHLAVEDRRALLRHVMGELAPNDQDILTLRHFDGLSNAECAEILSIDPKAASIRYARALVRLRKRLADYSEFKP